MSYNVTARRREIAIRLALGSRPSRQVQVVMRRGLLLATIGLGVGTLLSAHALFSLNALPVAGRPDPATFAGIGAVLILVTLIACGIPALRVTGVDPVSALRQE
jgi:ABC-type antimicrobial peptide transport system permease subunit